MSNLPFNIVDGVVIALIVLSALFAFFRGFTREVLSIAAWVGAAFIALYLFPTVRPYARQYIPIELVADVVTAAGIFIIALIILSMITGSIASLIQRSAIGPLDRTLGFVFGLVRGLAIVSVAYLVVTNLSSAAEDPPWLRDAKTLPIIRGGAEFASRLVPGELRDKSIATAREIKQNGDAMIDTATTLDALRGAPAAPPPPAAAPVAPVTTTATAAPAPAAAQPAAAAPAQPAGATGYKQGERKAMDQLFHTN